MLCSTEPPVIAMADVINLGRARKRKREAAEKRRADENAIRHGRSKAEKARERSEQARLRAAVDGARREPGRGEAKPDAPDVRPAVQPAATDDEPGD